ncbi:EpsG family protein [Pseudomonas sp. SA3-5]|uniref:EpsG family protein n=1 Tax=Pseudomonas aestuarii TaxID=3018340 RepID=A0ABT4XJY3_9PSED|nr:EpsG family protein [Pseudomonas aestuarii]MDA7088505.1 EpsG family protein [Pseudomonas aestuarii]
MCEAFAVVSLRNLISIFTLFLFFLTLSVFVGTRDVSVGADTANYAGFFNDIEHVIDVSRFEPLFKYLTYGIGLITDSHEWYFMIVFLIFNFFYLYFYSCVSDKNKWLEGCFILIGLMLSSSWYVVATTNGLRQGLSLPILYLSILFFYKRRFIPSALFFLVSLGFHKAVILALPFFCLVFLRPLFVFLAFIVSAVLYFFGVTEVLVRVVSGLLSISLYDDIANYSSGSNNWVGFQAAFFLYTIFWACLFYFSRCHVKDLYLEGYIALWKFYCVLMMPYFFFGFGAYSNRYAFIGWLLLPVIQSFFIVSSRLDRKVKFLLGVIFFVFGFSSYLYLLLGSPLLF